MIAKIPKVELAWLENFFSGRNQLQWENLVNSDVQPNNIKALLVSWLQQLHGDAFDGVLMLPRVLDGTLVIYAMASDDKRFSQMLDEITAFIGPSFSDFNGTPSSLDMTDPCESALIKRFGAHVVKIHPMPPDDSKSLEGALKLYSSVLQRRPDIPDRTQRPFGRIRADFDTALLTGNSEAAQTLLDELVATGRVNAEQHKCLQVRFLYGLGRVEELASNRMLIASIADLSLPTQTLVDVVSALYETFVSPIEKTQYHEVLDVFKKHILQPFGSLFRERKGILRPKVLRAFLLSELGGISPNFDRCKAILAAYPRDAEGFALAKNWYDEVNAVAPLPSDDQKQDVLVQARQAVDDEDFETAYPLCYKSLPNQLAYRLLVRCALEISDITVTQQTLDALDEAPYDVQTAFSVKDNERLTALRAMNDSLPVSKQLGWLVWAEKVVKNPATSPSVTDLQDIVAKWSVLEYLGDPQACMVLADTIANAESRAAQEVFRESFAVLVDFFYADGQAPRAFKGIYSSLITTLVLSGTLTDHELAVVSQLTQLILDGAPTNDEYLNLLLDLLEILKIHVSQVHIDWALNLAELLAQYPAPDEGKLRVDFFVAVVGMMRGIYHRLTLTQKKVLEGLSLDYRCPDLLNSFPQVESVKSDAASNFDGRIGIYTLTLGVGKRAKEILETLFPNAVVELNSDHVKTSRLTTLAQTADVFVFAWKSSKHQAYYCVKDARQGREILLPVGKGSASILSAVVNSIPDLSFGPY